MKDCCLKSAVFFFIELIDLEDESLSFFLFLSIMGED
mgnify:CR=1 FL=1